VEIEALASVASASRGTAMITITTTANGIRLTRNGDAYTVTGPRAAAVLIRRLTAPAPATVAIAAPAQLGQRLVKARARYLVEV
jgi:hypothetical protein